MILRIILVVVLYLVLGFALWWYIEPVDPIQRKDFLQLMAQIAAGGVLLIGLYFAWRRLEISQRTLETQQDQQVTERFTRAIDQLGATDDKGEPRLEIRLGGIYALERIARDSPERDYSTVMEVLTAYIRENSPTPAEPVAQSQTTNQPDEATNKVAKRWLLGAPADIQAILDVLRRRDEDRVPEERRFPLDLRRTDLRGANLLEVNFREANLAATDLDGADLRGADLMEANLERARITYLPIQEANLQGAFLSEAYLLYAQLDGADLREAYCGKATFHSADLVEADLRGADFQGATFSQANLEGADLKRAKLQGADLRWATSLTQEQIEEAIGDTKTKLPEDLTRPKSWTEGGE